MADLSSLDKLKLEKAFGMEGGYVLKFSNQTLRTFVLETVQLDVYSEKYNFGSCSKANRLRALWAKESNLIVSKLIAGMLTYAQEVRRMDGPPFLREEIVLFKECKSIANRLQGIREQNTTEFISDLDTAKRKDLHDKLLELTSMGPQKRGYAFEIFLKELFAAFNLNPKSPFRITGEQIDGSLELDKQIYLIEAKWQDAPVAQKELFAFAGKISGKATWSRGIFVSYTGFSQDSISAYSKGHPANFITVDGLDLSVILAGENGRFLDLDTCLRKKIRHVAETGNIILSASDILRSL